MGLFDSFFGKKANTREEYVQMVKNLLTKEIESNYTNKMTTTEFKNLISELSSAMQGMLSALDQNLIHELKETLSLISKNEQNDLFNLVLALCWSRLQILEKNPEQSHLVQNDILGTANALLNVIHHQIQTLKEINL